MLLLSSWRVLVLCYAAGTRQHQARASIIMRNGALMLTTRAWCAAGCFSARRRDDLQGAVHK